jgi:WD40 repeat protein
LRSFYITDDGKWIYGGSLQGEMVRISVETMEEEVLFTSDIKEPIFSLEASHHDPIVVFAAGDYVIRIWDMETDQITEELYGHTARISDIDFSYNGKLMASSSWDGTVQLWYMDNLTELSIILDDNHDSWVWDVDFSPDDKYLVVGTRDNKIKRWAVDASLYADQLCSKISRSMTTEEWERYVGNGIEYRNTCESVVTSEDL